MAAEIDHFQTFTYNAADNVNLKCNFSSIKKLENADIANFYFIVIHKFVPTTTESRNRILIPIFTIWNTKNSIALILKAENKVNMKISPLFWHRRKAKNDTRFRHNHLQQLPS
ncbi:hypothetical protein G4B88_001902 [Cannabis sativa]|uniref:Uncharacterized protein n=1 Tax=Cannabis sativa TaxID=3483 RepID=A0A7J6HEU6_CANSA|nr:hypothetical protein G4B88_001902 [Cannabis sativa]